MSLAILTRFYFYLIWTFWILLCIGIQTVVWPFFINSASTPQLILNNLIAYTLVTFKPSSGPFILTFLFFSTTSNLNVGYYLVPGLLLFTLLQIIKNQTFILNKRSLFWILIGSHFFFIATQEFFFSFWSGSPLYIKWFDSIISIFTSLLFFPVQKNLLKKALAWWKTTRFGELGYE